MLDDPLLGGPVVVGGHHEEGVGARGLSPLGDAHGVRCVVGARAGQDHGAVAHGLADLADQGVLLRLMRRGGLAGGPGQQDAVAAVVDQLRGQGRGRVDVEGAVLREGRDHGDGDGSECALGQSLNHREDDSRRGGVMLPCSAIRHLPER